jgi:hypothetical protein
VRAIGDVDILFISVGGSATIGGAPAAPSVVLPAPPIA